MLRGRYRRALVHLSGSVAVDSTTIRASRARKEVRRLRGATITCDEEQRYRTPRGQGAVAHRRTAERRCRLLAAAAIAATVAATATATAAATAAAAAAAATAAAAAAATAAAATAATVAAATAAAAIAAAAAAATATAVAAIAVAPSLPRPPLRSTVGNDDDDLLGHVASIINMEAKEREKPLVKDLNEHIVCPLCRGYLIDATTLVECLHSFCRGCIVRRLSSGARACPVCNVAASPPLLPDTRLQRLVYLAVPGLFRSELERRRHFRLVNPQCPPLASPVGALELTLEDLVSLSLKQLPENAEDETKEDTAPRDSSRNDEVFSGGSTRYLKCPAAVTVRHLVRLLMLKRGWEEANATVNGVNNRIEIVYQQPDDENMRPLDPSWTLLDLACIFRWEREAPMRLFYRVLRKEEAVSTSKAPSSCKDNDATKDGTPTMENMQRPPTPPPSPKPGSREPEAGEARGAAEAPRVLETSVDVRDKETKTKKPRCEVTPVMRAPDPPIPGGLATSNHHHQSAESAKSKDPLTRLEHRKRRKRRNKRVIAEITTTPREDLLKLKVRLTPCPPRITSGTATGGGAGGVGAGSQTKEKLLQMRAVRREKIKATIGQQRSTTASSLAREEVGSKECAAMETEETIEDIIDSIPDEVVHIAQNIGNQNEDVAATERMTGKKEAEPTSNTSENNEPEKPKKDEEILRRLGLVAINEAGGNKTAKQRAQSGADKTDSLDREKLEKQLRESKANRVRSLLAEKQMRDALKSIMSKTKEDQVARASSPASSSAPIPVSMSAPKKKEPPPLAPLRVAKPSGFAATSGSLLVSSNTTSKYETPLDLSSGGAAVNDNVLDLSATLPGNNGLSGKPATFSSSSSPSSSSSSSSSSSPSPSPSSCTMPSLSSSLSSSRPPARPAIGGFLRKSAKDLEQQRGRGQQESNLRTLSDVAVSRLSGCLTEKNPEPLALASANVHASPSKVALRIPQLHQRIPGFNMKIKPNLGVRHIPNPQAVVASQYRNQRASYFNAVSQQPPL